MSGPGGARERTARFRPTGPLSRPIPSQSETGTIIKNCDRVPQNEMVTHDHGSRIAEWAELVGADVPESALPEQSADGTAAESDWQVSTDEAE